MRGESWWGHREENTLRNETEILLYHIMYNYVDAFLASEREKFNFFYVFVEHYGMWSHHHE